MPRLIPVDHNPFEEERPGANVVSAARSPLQIDPAANQFLQGGAASPNWGKWGVSGAKTPKMLDEVTQHVEFNGGKITYRDMPEATYIDGLIGGARAGVQGAATRAVKAVIENSVVNQGKPVIATSTGGAKAYWSGSMGFRAGDNQSHIMDSDQLSKISSGDITTTAWPHPRGYGDMFADKYGPMINYSPVDHDPFQ